MTTRADMIKTRINGKWSLHLPHYRAERTEWSDPGWEPERLDSMRANLQPGDVLIDVGTEEGDLTGLYAQWGCHIVMIEPNPRVWPNVRAIFETERFDPPVAWFQGFASNIDRNAELTPELPWPDCASGPLMRAHGFTSMVESFELVPHIRIDTLVDAADLERVDAITIDIEGAEMLALEGAAGTLDQHRPLVWVSVHDEMIRHDYGYTSESVHQYMALHDYRMQLLAIDHECHWFYWPKERTAVLP